MEMKNFTGGENLQTAVEFFCSAEFTGEVHGELIFLSVVNTCLSITAFLGERSDPSCPKQGQINSSAVQTPVS